MKFSELKMGDKFVFVEYDSFDTEPDRRTLCIKRTAKTFRCPAHPTYPSFRSFQLPEADDPDVQLIMP